ncbi:unnamed protein product [Lactuca virosa]|uniref:Uncharacterized protein n=1 Tax=Lactuca virosa TaxID=75947 RepID=A0AAU9MK95_9ASTR|nr:unnamed protein product [Lactuca virosa]
MGSTEIVLQTTEQIQQVRQRLLTAQSRQKSYADRRRAELEFQVGDFVLLKGVSLERSDSIQEERQAGAPVHWAVQGDREGGQGSVSVGATCGVEPDS